jgi:hypothetical protein
MLIYFFVLITIATLIMRFINKIEPFTMPYVPTAERNISSEPATNLNLEITDPKLEYNQAIINWQNYVKTQKQIRNAHEVKGINPGVNPEVAKNLQWRIHRWSVWDYLPSLKNPYYCKVRQYNGKETCQPLTDKLYCSVNNVFKNPNECLKTISDI